MININDLMKEINNVYLRDSIPWVIGFSGGKDSTTLLQLVFQSLSRLSKDKLTKEIHVVSNDTLVENPVILNYLESQLEKIKDYGKNKLYSHKPELFHTVKVKPKLKDTFWVNLIGKGYPSPNRWFRWCTKRIKIRPTTDYILNTVNNNGSSMILLGIRKAESSNRAASMKHYHKNGKIRKHSIDNAYVYAPIADMHNNEVWAYLLQSPNPWGSSNKELLSLYSNACDGGECPFAIETGTQSCGKSRFGCWVCTVVRRDISMENMLNNGEEWLKDLLDFRNWLYDIRQQSNQFEESELPDEEMKLKFGPFLLRTRREILNKLVEIQEKVGIELIEREEFDFIEEIFNKEMSSSTNGHIKQFRYKLRNGKYLTTIGDFDILRSTRNRLGFLSLKGAELLESKKIKYDYKSLNRMVYSLE